MLISYGIGGEEVINKERICDIIKACSNICLLDLDYNDIEITFDIENIDTYSNYRLCNHMTLAETLKLTSKKDGYYFIVGSCDNVDDKTIVTRAMDGFLAEKNRYTKEKKEKEDKEYKKRHPILYFLNKYRRKIH